jgi:hypothetical protein
MRVISPLVAGSNPALGTQDKSYACIPRSNVVRIKINGAQQWAGLLVVLGLAACMLRVLVFPNQKFAPFSDLES